MDKNVANLLRMTAANMTELLNRVADHIEELEFKLQKLDEQIKALDDQVSR